jgi:hypothetical protein
MSLMPRRKSFASFGRRNVAAGGRNTDSGPVTGRRSGKDAEELLEIDEERIVARACEQLNALA